MLPVHDLKNYTDKAEYLKAMASRITFKDDSATIDRKKPFSFILSVRNHTTH